MYKSTEELIVGYFERTLSHEEMHQLMQWLEEDEENRRHFLGLKAINDLRSYSYDTDDGWLKLRRKITSGRRRRFVLAVSAAAASLIIAVFSLGLAHYEELLSAMNRCCEAPRTNFSTGNSIASVALPDGSIIKLAPYSQLSYDPIAYNTESSRKVSLSGEGYFEVASNADRPFIVESDKQNILVTGTRFNINSYPADNVIETTLLEGRIIFNLSEGNKSIVMRPGEQIIYNHAENTIEVKRPENPDDAIDWIDSRYEFDGIPLHDILWQMKNVYNVTFSCSDIKALETKYNVTFYQGESLKEFIRIVSNMSGLSCVERNDTIVFQ